MTWQQTIDEEKESAFEEGREQGFEQRKSEKALEAAENLLRMNILSLEQIAQAQGLTLEKVQELAKNLSI